MNQEELLDRQIENYIHHRMDEAERKAFEHSLISDPELKKQVFALITIKALYNKDLFDLKKQLDEAEAKLRNDHFFSDGKES